MKKSDERQILKEEIGKNLILKMRFCTLLVSFVLFQLSANSVLSQDRMNFNFEKVSLKHTLNGIKTQTGYSFFYNVSEVKDNQIISLEANNETIREVLGKLALKTNIDFIINGRQIVLTKKDTPYKTQLREIKGLVKDSDGVPLPGANIIEKGTTNGVTTDFDGKFSLKVGNENAVLIFTYVGFEPKEIALKGQENLVVQLVESAANLDEVVVIGYGTAKKSDLTGSVAGIKSEEIVRSRDNTFLSGIQGKIPGVRVSSSSGEPGAASNITIRGANSVYGSSTPLFVIDGIPVDLNNGEVANSGIGNGQSYDPLSSINPSDIESIEVLKDASATAIYGSRGANGVVIVTTKTGSQGKSKIVFDTYISTSLPNNTLEVLSADEFIDYRRVVTPDSVLFYEDTNGDGAYNELDKQRNPYELPSHNWQKEILRTALAKNYNLSLSGGSAKTKYAGSIGYLDQEGIVSNNDYQRYNFRLKLDHNFDDKLSLGFNSNTSYSELNGASQSGGGTGIFNGVVQNLVISRPVEIFVPTWDQEGQYISPASMINDAYKKTNLIRSYLNTYLDYKLIKGLSINLSLGGVLSTSQGKEFYGSNTHWGVVDKGRAIIQDNQSVSWYNTNRIDYSKSWVKHNLSLMAAIETNQYDFNSLLAESANFPDESTGVEDISKGANVKRLVSDHWRTRRISYFGRLNYGYLNKYLFTATYRADGSDKFGPNNRFGYFPSFALAWKVIEEPFMSKQTLFSDFKLRVSYGKTGNERIPAYQYFAGMENAYYNGQLGMAPKSFANPNLKWEYTDQFDVGIDLALWKGLIQMNVDYYKKQTKNMLLPAFVSSQSGYNRQWQNLGQVDNEGVEFQLSAKPITSENFNWSTNFSFSRNKNIVRDLGDVDFIPVVIGGGWITNVGRVSVGQPLGTAYGYLFDGVYQIDDFTWQNDSDSTIEHGQRQYTLKEGEVGVNGIFVQPGSFKFKDLDGNGMINDDDKTTISKSNPTHFGGFTNTFNYKGLELSLFFEWSYGNEIFNESRWRLEGGVLGTWMNISKEFWENRWTPENPSNSLGTFAELNKTSLLASSYYVEDASWVRFRSMSMSYSLPKSVVENMGIADLRFSFIGNNLMTWTKYTGFDPEMDSGNALLPGFDRISYPRTKSFIFGLKVSL